MKPRNSPTRSRFDPVVMSLLFFVVMMILVGHCNADGLRRIFKKHRGNNNNKQKIPVILDTDIGTFADDIYAIAAILNHPRLDLRLVVGTGTEPAKRARCAERQLRLSGFPDIPVAEGLSPSTSAVDAIEHAGKGFGTLDVLLNCSSDGATEEEGSVLKDGVQVIADTIANEPSANWAYILIGPATTAAELARRFPEATRSVKAITIMAGSFCAGLEAYPGAYTPLGETNALLDIPGQRDVLAGVWGRRPAYAPLVLGIGTRVEGSHWQAIRASQHPVTKTMIQLYDEWHQGAIANNQSAIHGEAMAYNATLTSVPLFDPIAAVLATQLLPEEGSEDEEAFANQSYSIHLFDIPSVNFTDAGLVTVDGAISDECDLTNTTQTTTMTMTVGGHPVQKVVQDGGYDAEVGLGFAPLGKHAFVNYLGDLFLGL